MTSDFVLAGLLLSVAGCAAPASREAIPFADAASTVAIGSFDGAYRGTASKTAGINPNCDAPVDTTFLVKNGVITRRSNLGRVIEATVQPSGRFSGQYGATWFTGTISNGHMEVNLGNSGCAFQYILDRI